MKYHIGMYSPVVYLKSIVQVHTCQYLPASGCMCIAAGGFILVDQASILEMYHQLGL